MVPTKLGALRGGSIGNLSRLVNRKARSTTYDYAEPYKP